MSRARWLIYGSALLLLVAGFCWRWSCDDAFIDFRVVRNLFDGQGPVYNADTRVEAFTSPLWIALLTLAVLPWRLFHFSPLPLEWVAVVLGLAGSALGVVAAGEGCLSLARQDGEREPVLPLAGILLAVLPASWAFATCGLETGLVTAWIGSTFWAVSNRRGAALVVGLGPLVRPDLTILAFGFAAFFCWRGPRSLRVLSRFALHAALLPLVYELFRMGYFAALSPTTAMAKEAFSAYWSQGAKYACDFVLTYALWVPLVVVAALVRARRQACLGGGRWILVAAGAAHALCVVRWGGDFMHARMLLPAWLMVLLPFTVTLDRRSAPLLVLLGAWAVVCALLLRSPLGARIGPDGIADERAYYVLDAAVSHPVLAADYRRILHGEHGRRSYSSDRDLFVRWSGCFAALPPSTLVISPLDRGAELDCDKMVRMPLAAGLEGPAVLVENIGITGWSAPRVHIIDAFGLSDPIIARFRLTSRSRPGHEKQLPGIRAWTIARYTDAAEPFPSWPKISAEGVAQARAALQCGDLRELLAAVSGPLTARRFLRNLAWAPRLTSLRIASHPDEARRELCDQVSPTAASAH